MDRIVPQGEFIVECRDKNGNLKWKDKFKNGVTDVGLTNILQHMFNTQNGSAAWYLGLIDNSGYTGLSAGDTMSTHAGWAEFTSYSSATRPAWATGAAAAKTISNSSPISFSITGSGTLKGFFCNSNSTKGGTTGTLWATALFASGDQAVVNGDVLNVTYTITAGI